MRIGIFGGAFDPIHNGHMALAQAALKQLDLQQVRFVPSSQPPHRQHAHANIKERLNMLHLALQHEPAFIIDEQEIERQEVSYTIYTLQALRARYLKASWFLLIGFDQYQRFQTWYRWQDILQLAQLVVAHRPLLHSNEVQPLAKPAILESMNSIPCIYLNLPMQAISSSQIRSSCYRHQDISKLVPTEVALYIEAKKLYINNETK